MDDEVLLDFIDAEKLSDKDIEKVSGGNDSGTYV